MKQPGSPIRVPLSRGALLSLGLFALVLLVATGTVAVTSAGSGARPSEEASSPALAPAAVAAAEAELRAALEDRAFPGAALALGVGPRVERVTAVGAVGWRAAAAPVSPDSTLYDLASLTKAVATTTAVLLLVDDGRIALDEPVQRWLPEFEGQLKELVTWRHLLTHTSGLPGGAVIRGSEAAERLRRLLRTRIEIRPGTQVEYTDLGFLVLWAAGERAAGEPLDRFLERRVWGPLGMTRTVFSPGQECEACAPTLRLEDGTPYRGRPHDLLARRLGGVVGNAGLFSTARDLSRFAAMIAAGGTLEGRRILSPGSVAELFRMQPGAGRRTLGWQAFCPSEASDESLPCAAPLAFGHVGYTGTSLWVDPSTGAWMVLLSNRTYDIRNPEAVRSIGELRERVWTAARAGVSG